MKKIRRFKDRLKEDLKEEAFQKAFESEDLCARLAVQIAQLREERGLTQKDLARRLHTSQQAISRLENPNNQSLSLNTLLKLAHALQKRLNIQFL